MVEELLGLVASYSMTIDCGVIFESGCELQSDN